MSFASNSERLNQLAKDFNTVSGVVVSIYDSERKQVAGAGKMHEFCALVRSSPELRQKCLAYDGKGFDECDRTREPCIYYCHMGLLEVTVPIIDNNYMIGYIQCGQFADKKDTGESLTRAIEIAQKYGVSRQELACAREKLKCRDREYVLAIAKLLESSACYIYLNGIIGVSRESVAYSINEYIHSHLSEQIRSVELCLHFGLSRSAMYQIAKSHFGCGVTEYVTQCRLNEAKRLLLSGDMNVSEVAAAVGITDANYFVRVFSRRFKMTPKQFQIKGRIEKQK